jgi:hypothetical protein
MHIYLFICYLHNLMPLVEYTKRNKKEFKESPKHPHINLLIYFIFFSYQFWALHNHIKSLDYLYSHYMIMNKH